MAVRRSAGLVMYRRSGGRLQVLLAHPGGPFFARKDDGCWTIPKGEYDEDESPLEAAQREFLEETALEPCGPFFELGEIRQKAGKIVRAWAFAGDCDPAGLSSNNFEMEWPPRSGRTQSFPEIDRCEFFDLEIARTKINPAQIPLLDALAKHASSQ